MADQESDVRDGIVAVEVATVTTASGIDALELTAMIGKAQIAYMGIPMIGSMGHSLQGAYVCFMTLQKIVEDQLGGPVELSAAQLVKKDTN